MKKPKDIGESEETFKKEADVFVLDHNSILSGERFSLEEEHWERKKETFERERAGLCPKCGLPIVFGREACDCGKTYHQID